MPVPLNPSHPKQRYLPRHCRTPANSSAHPGVPDDQPPEYREFPEPGSEFDIYAEELLFHTSRYYAYTERFLRRLASDRSFSMSGYSACRLTSAQRLVMEHLLGCKPSPLMARRIISIVNAVKADSPSVDPMLYCCCMQSRRYRGSEADPATPSSPSTGILECDHLTDPLCNLTRRFGIPLEIKGNTISVSLRRLLCCLDSPNPRVRQCIQEMLLYLHQAGYRIHNPSRRHYDA